MKVSEFISKLHEAECKYGDREIFFPGGISPKDVEIFHNTSLDNALNGDFLTVLFLKVKQD